MKKIFFFICFSLVSTAFAQDISSEDFTKFREQADSLFIKEQLSSSVELYKRLALSGDATSAYELFEIYSQGMGVDTDVSEAKKWLNLANSIDERNAANKNDSDNSYNTTLEEALNLSGELFERGAVRKNAAIVTGVTGGLTGGIMLIVGVSKGHNNLSIAGGCITAGLGIVAIILDAIGNSYIKDGSKILKNIQFEESGIKVKF